MKELKKRKSKKAVSPIIAYVLLISFVLVMAITSYNFMKRKIPGIVTAECPDEVSLYILGYTCNKTTKSIELNFKNSGNFNIIGVIIRASNESNGMLIHPLKNEMSIGSMTAFQEELSSGNEDNLIFNYSDFNRLEEINIIPVFNLKNVGEKSQMVQCTNRRFNQKLGENC